ncbi:V-type ATP synthase subunit I domain-containing protein [Thermococcus barophilus]|nr:hypothetical protein [Thermococcus barophilus]
MVAKAYDFDPLPKPRKRPGRPPKWKQGTKSKTFRIPTDLAQKLKRLVQEGKFESEVEAIYHYVMFADRLDELFERIKRLETQLEVKEKENEALRARIKVLESEKEELEGWKQKAKELEKKLEELQVELIKVKGGFDSLKSEDELKGGEPKDVRTLENADLWGLVERLLELKSKVERTWSQKELDEIEREQRRIAEEVNAVLERRGIDKVSFWKVVNQKGLDEAKRLFGE